MNLLIDASNIMHRSYWIANKDSVDADHNYQIYLFLKSLKGYCDRFKPTSVYCVWDDNLDTATKCFREELHGDTYKANRDPAVRERVYECFDKLKAMITSLGCLNIFPYALEGDDVIAFLCEHLEGRKMIVSADRDLLQLVNQHIQFFNVNKKLVIGVDNFKDEYEVDLIEYVRYKCLTGDPADNIPKVLTPAKVKKFFKGELKLNEEQQKQYDINFLLTSLYKSYERQPGEYHRMVEQLNSLEKKGSFKQFLALCSASNMKSIANTSDDWRSTFFTSKSLTDIVNRLNMPK